MHASVESRRRPQNCTKKRKKPQNRKPLTPPLTKFVGLKAERGGVSVTGWRYAVFVHSYLRFAVLGTFKIWSVVYGCGMWHPNDLWFWTNFILGMRFWEPLFYIGVLERNQIDQAPHSNKSLLVTFMPFLVTEIPKNLPPTLISYIILSLMILPFFNKIKIRTLSSEGCDTSKILYEVSKIDRGEILRILRILEDSGDLLGIPGGS